MAVYWKKGNIFNNFYGTNAERITQTGMETGDIFKTSDTLKVYVYTGSVWILDENEVTINAGDIEIGAVELKDSTSDQRAAISATGELSVAVKSNGMELYGATTATRPDATAVSAGTTFVEVASPLVVYMSDGTNWLTL